MRLGAFDAFAHMEPVHLAALADLAVERSYRAGDIVQREGTPALEIHYLIEGEVEIRPRDRPVRRLGPLSVINGLAAFAEVTRSDEVVAIADTTTLSFTHEDQEDVFEEQFEILARLLREVAGSYLDARRTGGTDGGPAMSPLLATAVTAGRMGLVAKMAALRAATPFDKAPLEALAELARESPEAHYPAGRELWSAGGEAGWSVAIVSGSLTGVADGGRERLRFGPGTMPGVLDTMAGRPRWFDAVAETDVVGLRIDGGALFDLLEDHTDMAFQLLRSMSREILALGARASAAAATGPARPAR